MPAAGGQETTGRVPSSPGDCSPSRARLGRVAAMLREAELAEQGTGRPERDPHATSVVLTRRRARRLVPVPRLSREN